MNLPPQFYDLQGRVSFIRQKSHNEYSSNCPECGGDIHQDGSKPDRFILLVHSTATGGALGFCRRCGFKWWEGKTEGKDLTPEEKQKWIEEREAQALLARQQAEKEYLSTLSILRKEQMWVRYHDNLDERARRLWKLKGIPEEFQNYWQLGYCPDFSTWANNAEFHSPSLTIPIFAKGWEAVNIRHRLLNPPDAGDKYRPERSGLHVPSFISNPDIGFDCDRIIIVEGEVKAAVTHIELDEKDIQIVGITGKEAWRDLADKVKGKEVWINFDPDALNNGIRCAMELHGRLLDFPHKIDDAINSGDINKKILLGYMNTARQY